MKHHHLLYTVAVACLAAASAQAEAQEPGSKKTTPARGDAVIVKGCVSGPTIQSTETVTTDDTGLLSMPLTYQLKGDKKLLKQLREHDGELVEVSGILRSTLPQDSSIRGKSMGKTKVTLGIGTPSAQRSVPDPGPSLPVLDVRSYEAPGARCSSR